MQAKESSNSVEDSVIINPTIYPIAEAPIELSNTEFSSLSEEKFIEKLRGAIDDIPEVNQQADNRLFKISLNKEVSLDNKLNVKFSLTKSGFLSLDLFGDPRKYLRDAVVDEIIVIMKKWLAPYLTQSLPILINNRLSYERDLNWKPTKMTFQIKKQILEARLADDKQKFYKLISSLAPWDTSDPIVALIWTGWLSGLVNPKDENRVWVTRGVFDLDKKNQRSYSARALLQDSDHFKEKLLFDGSFVKLAQAFSNHSGTSAFSMALSATLDPRLANFFGHVAVFNPDIKSLFVEGDGIKRELEVFFVFGVLSQDIVALGSDDYNAFMASPKSSVINSWPSKLGPPRQPGFDIDIFEKPEFQLEWRKFMVKYYWTLLNDHVKGNEVIRF